MLWPARQSGSAAHLLWILDDYSTLLGSRLKLWSGQPVREQVCVDSKSFAEAAYMLWPARQSGSAAHLLWILDDYSTLLGSCLKLWSGQPVREQVCVDSKSFAEAAYMLWPARQSGSAAHLLWILDDYSTLLGSRLKLWSGQPVREQVCVDSKSFAEAAYMLWPARQSGSAAHLLWILDDYSTLLGSRLKLWSGQPVREQVCVDSKSFAEAAYMLWPARQSGSAAHLLWILDDYSTLLGSCLRV